MRVIVLSSGSKGNSVYIETNNHRILVDIGTSSLYVERSLKNYNIDPKTIDSIFITHAHTDHIAGINVFSKKYHPDIYLTEKIEKEAKLNIVNQVYINKPIILDTLTITPIKTSHDAADSHGYLFEENGTSVVYITDTGYINSKYHLLLQNQGHLSNKDSAYYLSNFIGDKTKYIVLAHLSEENNDPELALESLTSTLKSKNINFVSDNIYIAKQNETLGVFEL